jgi:biopolymer transport protein ExbB/TolQ
MAALNGAPAEDANAASTGLMAGLNKVTDGLSTAFDTTLIALVMAILLLFPTESLRMTEYRMLDRIEAFTNESLIRRMADERVGLSAEDMPEVVRDALEVAFAEHQRWLAQWQTQVSQLGQVIGTDFESVVDRVQQNLSSQDGQRMQKLEDASRLLEEIFQKVDNATISWHRSEKEALSRSREFVTSLTELQQSMTNGASRTGEILDQQARLLEMYSSGGLAESIQKLQEQIGRLAERVGAASVGDGAAPAGGFSTGAESGDARPQPESPGGLLSRLRGRRR